MVIILIINNIHVVIDISVILIVILIVPLKTWNTCACKHSRL